MGKLGAYEIVEEAQRRLPDAATIAAIRARYPVESEHDAVLTRKMERRHGPGYQGVTLERLVEGTKALIEANLDQNVVIENAGWLSGGASKLQVLFDLRWRGEDGAGERLPGPVRDLRPEVPRVGVHSVVAAVRDGGHHGQHLPLRPPALNSVASR